MAYGIKGLTAAIRELTDYLEKIGIDADFINNIEKTLINVNSLAGLSNVAQSLSEIANLAFYGGSGFLVGNAILNMIQTYSSVQQDQDIRAIVNLQIQQTIIAMASLRQTAGINVNQFDLSAPNQRSRLSNESRIIVEEARNIIRNSEITDLRVLQLLTQGQKLAKSMLDVLYNNQLQNDKQSPEYLLDNIGQTVNWARQFNQLCSYDFASVSVAERINFNYHYIRTLYELDVKAIECRLIEKLNQKGGNVLFEYVANHYNGTRQVWFDILTVVMSIHTTSDGATIFQKHPDLTPIQDQLRQLAFTVRTLDKVVDSFIHDDHGVSKENKLSVKQILINHAIAKMAFTNATYLHYPKKLPRSVYNGIVDMVVGTTQVVKLPFKATHNLITAPIDSACKAGATMQEYISPSRWAEVAAQMGTAFYNDPVRFFTSFACNAALGKLLTSVPVPQLQEPYKLLSGGQSTLFSPHHTVGAGVQSLSIGGQPLTNIATLPNAATASTANHSSVLAGMYGTFQAPKVQSSSQSTHQQQPANNQHSSTSSEVDLSDQLMNFTEDDYKKAQQLLAKGFSSYPEAMAELLAEIRSRQNSVAPAMKPKI